MSINVLETFKPLTQTGSQGGGDELPPSLHIGDGDYEERFAGIPNIQIYEDGSFAVTQSAERLVRTEHIAELGGSAVGGELRRGAVGAGVKELLMQMQARDPRMTAHSWMLGN